MEELGNIASAEDGLLAQVKEIFSHIRLAGQTEPINLEKSLEILKSLRQLVYEDMNQLQHEALILKAAKLLQSEFYPNINMKWLWNPRQTGTKDEPDLQGFFQGRVILSAEATSSLKPKGEIGSRMAKTLQKLSTQPGEKYYIVITAEMERRAKSKVSNLGYQINILLI